MTRSRPKVSKLSLLRFARFLFWSATAFALIMASLPVSLPGDPSDKALHMGVFAVLALLAAFALSARATGSHLGRSQRFWCIDRDGPDDTRAQSDI